MKVAIASPPYPKSIEDGLSQVEKMVKEAAEQQAEIICFPESYIPGYPTEEFEFFACLSEMDESVVN